MSLGPFDLPGEPFLVLYGTLLALTIVAGFLIPRWLRPEGRSARRLDTEQLAFLAGGKARFVDTVVARLLRQRLLSMEGTDKFRPERCDAAANPAERSVLSLFAPTSWSAIERALAPHAEPVEQSLIDADMLMDRGTILQMRFWQTLPYLMLIGFGLIKFDIGMIRHKPVSILGFLLVVTAVFALIRWVAIDRRTRAGVEAFRDARRNSDRLRRAPTGSETDLGVALFGTGVLAGSDIAPYHSFRSSTSSSSGDGGSGGGGDGGCGGGGCGGCS